LNENNAAGRLENEMRLPGKSREPLQSHWIPALVPSRHLAPPRATFRWSGGQVVRVFTGITKIRNKQQKKPGGEKWILH
jgi:hypothetical protein